MIALPDAADEVTAGVVPGWPPLVTTKISKLGVAEGAGTHWNAQPICQVPPAMVNDGLVQFPVCWVSGTSTLGGARATVDVVVDELPEAAADAVVVLVDPAAVDPEPAEGAPLDPAANGTVVGDEPEAGGSL